MNRASRGLLIALEGVDGTGKTTNIGPAISYLKAKGLDAVKTSEPTSGKIGSLVRFILEGHDAIHPSALALLFAADRVEHGAEIVDHLSHNRIIVSDRYLLRFIGTNHRSAGLTTTCGSYLQRANTSYAKQLWRLRLYCGCR